MFRFGAPTLGYLGHLNHPLVFQWDLNLKLRWWPFGWRATSVGPVEQAEDRDETFFKNSYCRWWQLRCFCDFHPGHWESFPFWRAYVSKGVGNHQLDSRFFLRFCCYRIGFQTHDEDMCSITVGEDMVEVKHLTTLLCWWTPMVVFHAKKKHKSAPSHWVPGDVKLILEAWCTLTPKPSLILSMTTLPAVMFLRSEVKGQGPFVGLFANL